jgi:hypothetical protein
MERIIFSISGEQKRWLAAQAQCQQTSMAEVIRQALQIYDHYQQQKQQFNQVGSGTVNTLHR